jgi:hypothetical protein
MRPDPVSKLLRLTESDIANFEGKMRKVFPIYKPGDRARHHGTFLMVTSYKGEGMPGYWLRSKKEVILPLDLEDVLSAHY